jgi:formate hydrogenlyase subunit 3/multisubunit Na+/H+ antiporter MnhD subunit
MFGLGIGFYYELPQAFSAGLFLFLVIAVMKTLAFLSAGVFQFYTGSQLTEQLRGIGNRMPLVALSFSIALAGLAGIPLLAGFTGKWLIFSTALSAGDLFAISCLGVFLTSTLIGLGGYLPTLVSQYLSAEPGETITERSLREIRVSTWMLTPVAVLAILVFLMGIFPAPWLALVEYVMRWMFI